MTDSRYPFVRDTNVDTIPSRAGFKPTVYVDPRYTETGLSVSFEDGNESEGPTFVLRRDRTIVYYVGGENALSHMKYHLMMKLGII